MQFAVQAGTLSVMLCLKHHKTILLLHVTSINIGAAPHGEAKIELTLTQLVICLRKRNVKWSLKGIGIMIKWFNFNVLQE